jgi:hypothetical protein
LQRLAHFLDSVQKNALRHCNPTLQAVKAAEDAAAQAAQAAQQAEAGGNPVDVVAKATLATQRCSQVIDHAASNLPDQPPVY